MKRTKAKVIEMEIERDFKRQKYLLQIKQDYPIQVEIKDGFYIVESKINS